MKFEYMNPNPKSKTAGDCVIRAFCIALGKDWSTVYREMCEIGAKHYQMPNSNKTIKIYAEQNGFRKQSAETLNGRRISVRDYAGICEYFNQTAILSVSGHLVAVVDGKYLDTWDCGGYKVFSLWVK